MQSNLEDRKIDIKVKLSSLWVAVLFCYIYGDYFSLYAPYKLENMLAGYLVLKFPATQSILLASAILMAIPSLMVFLCMVLPPKLNRLINIILGVIYTVVMLLTMLTIQWPFYLFLGLVEIALTLLIAWYAYNWPKNSIKDA